MTDGMADPERAAEYARIHAEYAAVGNGMLVFAR